MMSVNITLTMIIYNVLLKSVDLYIQHPLAGLFVHLFTPLLVIIDYILFGEKGNLKLKYPIYWSFSLFVYATICYLISFTGFKYLDGSIYPYFFMDISKYGIKVLLFELLILLLYLGYSYLVIWFDNYCSKFKKQ